jgi:hypothetical protein
MMGGSSARDAFFQLYGNICRCESCSNVQDWDGVREFAARGANQTVPVSHFGQINNAKIWLICFNPAYAWDDPNVGLKVGFLSDHFEQPIQAGDMRDFDCRADLPDEAVEEAVRRFSEYDFKHDGHKFFSPWMDALDGLSIDGDELTFGTGGICVVDAIKCPTRLPIGRWWGDDAKAVAANCGKTGNGFLIRQIALHQPAIVIFAGTQKLVPAAVRGRANRGLLKIAQHPYITAVRCDKSVPPRLCIELRSARGIKRTDPTALRGALQRVITDWNSSEG